MAIDDATVAGFAALFTGRTDAYGTFANPNGGEYVKRAPLTNAAYARHLRGSASLGVFPVRDDGSASFGMTDIDLPADPAEAFETAQRVAHFLLLHAQVMGWIERSRGKGYHVWTFHPGSTRAAAVRRLHQDACRAAEFPEAEIFPKQDHVSNGGLGNFCNLPYYGPSPDRRVMVDMAGATIPLADFLAHARAEFCPDVAPSAQEPPRQLPPVRPPDTGPRPACMQAIIDRSREPALFVGQRNEALIRLASYEVGTAQNPDAFGVVQGAGLNLGLDEQEIGHVHQMAQKGYTYGCDRKREIRVCADACTWAACRFHPGTPIEIVHGGTAVAEERDDDDTSEPGAALDAALYDEETVTRRAPQGWCGAVADYLVATRGVPRSAAYWSALVCVGAMLGNRAWFVGLDGHDTFAHLWLCILGPSGSGKSSTAESVLGFAQIPPNRMMPETGSPESWLLGLSAEGGQLMYQDELGNLLVSFKMRGMERSKFWFTTWFSAGRRGSRYRSLTRGEIHAPDLALSILACCTHTWLQTNITIADFGGGLLARWLLVQLESGYDGQAVRVLPDKEQADHLRRWALGIQNTVRGEIVVPDHLRQIILDWAGERQTRTFASERDGDAGGLVQRLGLYAMKLATILHAAGDDYPDPGKLVVREAEVRGALTLLDWLTPRMIALITTEIAGSDFEQKCQRMRSRVRAGKGQQLPWSQLRRIFGWESKTFNDVIAALQDQKRVVVEEVPTGRPGRPAKVVRSIEKGR